MSTETVPASVSGLQAATQAAATDEQEFGNFFLSRFLDLQISFDEQEQTSRVVLPYGAHLLNPQGSVHGGVIATAMDISMGHLCRRFLSAAVTVEMQFRFFRPLTGDGTCVGRFVRPGRRLVHVESRLTDTEGRLVALGMGSWHRLDAL